MTKLLATLVLIFGATFPSGVFAIDIPVARGGYADFTSWYEAQHPDTKLPFRTAAVFDYETLRPLYYHGESLVIPTASLMKLLTAGTFVKNQTIDWDELIGFSSADNDSDLRKYVGKKDRYVLLQLEKDEKISVRNMFASMLIISANNAAVRLAKYDAGSLSAFLKKMKTTALEWGMLKTKIDDPSGLSLKNVSTAHDLGLAICQALRNEHIAEFADLPEYDFSISLGREKILYHTVHAIRESPQQFFGGKTGFLRESKFHVAAGIITPHGRKICAAVLTSPTRAGSEAVLSELARWADEHYMWPGQ